MDDYQAFQFDGAVAYRYHMLEKEDVHEKLSFISNELRAIMRAMGNNQAKPIKFHKKLGKTTDKDQQERLEQLFGFKTSDWGDAGVS